MFSERFFLIKIYAPEIFPIKTTRIFHSENIENMNIKVSSNR